MGLMKYSSHFYRGLLSQSRHLKLKLRDLDPTLPVRRLKSKYLQATTCRPLVDVGARHLHYPVSNVSLDLGVQSKLRTFSDLSSVLSNSVVSKMASTGIDVRKEILLPFHARSRCRSTTDATHADQEIGESKEALLQNAIETSAHCLLNGGVLGVPTDTIYGIAGLAQNNEAVNRIYDIKQRNYEKPLAISVGTIDDIYKWSKVTVPSQLLSDLLPGPVTVVFERSSELNPALNPQTSLVGIRIPDHIFMKDLATKCNSPIALTSANVSGGKSCLQVEEFQHLWPLLDLVVNGGKLNDSEQSRLGSTVVDLSVEGTFRIIRPGSAHAATCAVLQNDYHLKETSQAGSSR